MKASRRLSEKMEKGTDRQQKKMGRAAGEKKTSLEVLPDPTMSTCTLGRRRLLRRLFPRLEDEG